MAICARVGVDRKLIVAATYKCIESIVKFLPEKDSRPAVAYQAVGGWLDGEQDLPRITSSINGALLSASLFYSASTCAAYATHAAIYAVIYTASAISHRSGLTASEAVYAAAAAHAACAVDEMIPRIRMRKLNEMANQVRQVILFEDVQQAVEKIKL